LGIDAVAGPWVVTIFRWFVEERLPIGEIVRRLNSDPSCPRPPRSKTGMWEYPVVRRLLRNARYRGWWQYGVMETVWISSKDYARQFRRSQPLKEAQIEELRLVPDDLWYQAQARLDKNESLAVGRKPTDGNTKSRPRLLRCPVHDRRLYVGGVHGKYMFCKVCKGLPAAQRPLFSLLPRKLALQKTCETLARLIRGDVALVERVIAVCRREAEALQQGGPNDCKKGPPGPTHRLHFAESWRQRRRPA
jgi:hypothetical protein